MNRDPVDVNAIGSAVLFENGRIIDPRNQIDRVGRVLVTGQIIAALDPSDADLPTACDRIDIRNQILAPGLIDLTAEFREPGFEEDETIQSGSDAALAGGYSSVLVSSSTQPVVDSAAAVQLVRQIAGRVQGVRVYPIACLSKGREADQMSELGTLTEAGAVAFSDSPKPMSNDALLKRALEYCRMLNRPIFDRPEVPELARGGVMHDGRVALTLGLRGLPTEAEDLAVARDVRLAEATKGWLHVGPISTMGAIDMIGRVRGRGIEVTASTCPHNLSGDDRLLESYDSCYKVHPPIRSPRHAQAVRNAIASGVITVIESGHMPRSLEKKYNDLDLAPFGAATLETTLGVCATELVHHGGLDWPTLIACLSSNPAQVAGIPGGNLEVGSPADIVVIDPMHEWRVDPSEFRSHCRSSPFAGRTLTGRPVATMVGGQFKFQLQTATCV
ncbi:MAG: dihydroorotase [Planctomycetota bacterium]